MPTVGKPNVVDIPSYVGGDFFALVFGQIDSLPKIAGLIIGVVLTATVVNQAKRAWEKHYDAKHSLKTLAGIYRNISRHCVRSACRFIPFDKHGNRFINRKTLNKAEINISDIAPAILDCCKIIGSARVAYACQRANLNIRNLNIDYQQLIDSIDKSGIEFDGIKQQENADYLKELNYLIKETLDSAYVFFAIAEKLERPYTSSGLINAVIQIIFFFSDILFAFAFGTTLTELTRENFFIVKYKVRRRTLKKIAFLFMDKEGDEYDLYLIRKEIDARYKRGRLWSKLTDIPY